MAREEEGFSLLLAHAQASRIKTFASPLWRFRYTLAIDLSVNQTELITQRQNDAHFSPHSHHISCSNTDMIRGGSERRDFAHVSLFWPDMNCVQTLKLPSLQHASHLARFRNLWPTTKNRLVYRALYFIPNVAISPSKNNAWKCEKYLENHWLTDNGLLVRLKSCVHTRPKHD